MLKNDAPEQQLPQPVALSEHADRLAQVAFCLSDPQRMALLDALRHSAAPATAAELAETAGVAEEVAETHLRLLRDHGLVRAARAGILRRHAYVTDIADVEIRFRGGEKAKGASGRTARALAKDAKRRERQAKRQQRQAEKIRRRAERAH